MACAATTRARHRPPANKSIAAQQSWPPWDCHCVDGDDAVGGNRGSDRQASAAARCRNDSAAWRTPVRCPTDEVDERSDRFRVAGTFGVGAVCLLSRLVPVTDDDLRPRERSLHATQQEIQLGRRDRTDRDEGDDIRGVIRLRLRGRAYPVKPPSAGQRATIPSSSRMASAISCDAARSRLPRPARTSTFADR